ncbi:MAG: hypothetical protein KTR30_38790 [Saprospiraceae bacterium]|nr:hypothetical protein [Saprospiraceae bacterium]
MSQKIITAVLFLFIGLSSSSAQSTDQITIGSKHFIQSEILSEEREYWLSLPYSYDRKDLSYKKYPIVILLDGNVHFHSVSGMVNFRSSGNTDKREIPEMIVVALLNVNRERDFTPDKVITRRVNQTGGGDKFLAFLESELIPKIEKEYRTIPYRMLIGHSLGGLFAVHAYMKEQSAFNSFISIDPSFGTWDNDVMDKKVNAVEQKIFNRPLFLATANWGKRNLRNRDRHIRYFESINRKCVGELIAEQKYYEENNHSSVPLPAIYDGLSFIFQGYNYSYRTAPNREHLVEHFEQFSNRLSYAFHPPEELVNRIGYRFLRSKSPEDHSKALSFFELNAENHPASFNVFDSLGEAQHKLGQQEKAIQSFKKSLELNADNSNARKMLDQLLKE